MSAVKLYPDWQEVQVESTSKFNQWRTLSPLYYPFKDGRVVVIRAGFETDLASIPRALWNLYPPFDPEYRAATILHDGLYASELLTRSEADWTLLEAMQAQGNSWWTRNVFWFAVRAGGAKVWAEHTDESRLEARAFVSIIPAEA
jgi:hypothetical protein